MKFFYLLNCAIIGSLLLFSSCNDSKRDKVRKEAKEQLQTNESPASTSAAATTTLNTEPHYKCPNNCEGGVGTGAGNCPVCGTALAHNQAFHNQPGNPTDAITPNTPEESAAQPKATEPAQNAKGVWHYTCSSGCSGGAGVAGNCATCGKALGHNQGYHN